MFTPEKFSLHGRKALVTGGATGIGQAIAAGLAACGADVVTTFHARPPDETVGMVEAAGRKAHALECDLSALDHDAAALLVDEAAAALGGIDVLVNNAGIIRRAPALHRPRLHGHLEH